MTRTRGEKRASFVFLTRRRKVRVAGGATCEPRGAPDAWTAIEDRKVTSGVAFPQHRRGDAREAYPAVLATLIGREVVPAGVPGQVTAAGLRRLPAALDRVRPKLLLLCLGGNDMLQRIDASMTAANLRSMVQVARDRGVPVVLIGVPKAPLFSGSVDYFEVIAREFGIPLENEIMASLFYDGSTKSDAVHPNAAGYRRMAEAIAVLLRRAGAVE